MAIGRTNAVSGSGGGLNFKVVPGLTQPGTATENAIWVKTDRINNYYFSATQPENVVAYDVWFFTGISSTVEFNALKRNGIQVYPLSAKQYISGAWEDVEVKIYQNGEWNYWTFYLYNEGDLCDRITGGWKAYTEGNTSFVQYEEDQIHEYADNGGVASASCKTNVPIGNNTVLKVEMSWTAIGTHTLLLRWDGDSGTMYGSTTITSGSPTSEISGSGVYSLSINRDGRANIALFSQASNAKVRARVKRVWLE